MAFSNVFDSSLVDYSKNFEQNDLEYSKTLFINIFKKLLCIELEYYNRGNRIPTAVIVYHTSNIFIKNFKKEGFRSYKFNIQSEYCTSLHKFCKNFMYYVLKDIIEISIPEINSKLSVQNNYEIKNPFYIKECVCEAWVRMWKNEQYNDIIKKLIPKY